MPPLLVTVLTWLRSRRLALGIIATLIALYGAFGYWIAPGIAREQIVKQLSAALDRKVTLEAVRINPFALSVGLSKFAIEEADGEPITAFDELFVNFSSASAIRFAWTFSEIRVTRLRVALVIRQDGSLNLAALGSSSPATTEEQPAGGLPRVAVGQLTVTNGQVGFEDRRGKRPFRSSVDAISFSLKDFSTLPDDEGLHAFSATTDLGERLAWRGRIGVNPLQSQGHVELTGIRVPRLAAYLLPGTVEVTEGAFEVGADYDVKLLAAGTELSVTGGRIALRDVRVKAGGELTPLNLEFAPIVLHLNGLTGRPGSRATASLEIQPNGAGKIAVRGSFGLDPLTADLNVSATDVALAPFQTFLEPYARLKLERGALHADGRFVIGSASEPAMRFEGTAAISDFSTVDSARGQGFARWRRLDVEKLAWSSQPPSLTVARIATDEPYLRFIIGPDRITNLQHILGAGNNPLVATGKPPATTPPMRLRIGLITVRNGSANFADQSLQPNFATGLQQLGGAVKGLSSQADARAAVALRGKVDRYAPATIEGEINPLAAQAYTDIGLRFENIELTTFTPYSGKFAGRRIDKGKLNLDLRYRLVERELQGENKIVFDQLTLGERVESPEALDLPLQLAIAILQDSRGVIDIDLPVRGNLDDPQFSYAGIIWKALVNLIMKAITAPFTLLASAFGGGEELGYVTFVPGIVEIGSGEQEKLDKLARALADRPQLRLEVRGAASGDDRTALAQAKLMQQVRGKDAMLDTPLTAAEQRRLLALHRKQFGEDPKLPTEVPAAEREARTIEAARARLVEATAVTDNELRELARDRGIAIGDYLVTRANIAKERVYLTDPNTAADTASDGVRSELKLAVR
jgi:uncharacterized protein involved in outer membrane biogenesis